MRFTMYRNPFQSHLAHVFAQHVAIEQVDSMPLEVCQRSDKYIEWICSITILREFMVKSRNHRLEYSPDLAESKIQELREKISRLKQLITINIARGFRKGRHIVWFSHK